MLTREIFGNVSDLSKLIFYLLSAVSLGVMTWGILRRVRLWRMGRPDAERIDWRTALANLRRLVVLQRRVRGRGAASLAHRFLFGGFLLLSIGTALIGVEHGLATMLGRDAAEPVFHKGIYFA